jgi:hypothetical protein
MRLLAVMPWLALLGCAVPAQMLAASDDLADYRAFRVAAHEGPRLARAQVYLKRHPHGSWADEVRGSFEVEENAWFEAAKTSRSRALDYVVELPQGPHVQAARALLLLFDEHAADIDLLELLAESRRTAALLDLESDRRKRVSEVVLEELGALMDPATWGAELDDPPPLLADVLRGSTPRTWGSAPGGLREDELFFVLPTPREPEQRVAQVRLRLVLERGRVAAARIEGEDLFVRWTEADALRVLDATNAADRATAASAVADVLAGALEARLPAARCAGETREGQILTRECDGWHVSVRMGARPGDDDIITVRVAP